MSQAISSKNRLRIRIPCADAFNRRRTVGVLREHSTGRIILAAPPGETAVLTTHEARLLAQQLIAEADGIDNKQGIVTQLMGRRGT